MPRHHLTKHDEHVGGEHSHAHHAKMAKHHLSELHKMAKHGHKAHHPSKASEIKGGKHSHEHKHKVK